jgi:two-component system response regulator RegX3
MASILIIEDEPAIRRGLVDLLAYHGHTPTAVEDGTSGLEHATSGRYDLCIVDVMLPGVDGLTICRKTRAAQPSQALLVLTARGRESDVLDGFDAGCDDYVAKPFSVAQLMARVDALLRRVGASSEPTPEVLRLGPLDVDADNLELRAGEARQQVTKRDVEVLQYLYAERHRIVSRNDLLGEVWGYARPEAVETRAVDMHLVKLRRKIDAVVPDGGNTLIETIRGAGYRLAVD